MRRKRNIIFFKQSAIQQWFNNTSELILPRGNHSLPFSIRLGHPLPPSIERMKLDKPYINYFIRVYIVQYEWNLIGFKKDFPITVHNNTVVFVNKTMIEPKTVNLNNIQTNVQVLDNVFIAGQSIRFIIDLWNPKLQEIHNIHAELVQIWDIGDNIKDRIVIHRQSLADAERFRDKHFRKIIELQIPLTTSPTFSFPLPDSSFQKQLIVHYELNVQISVNNIRPDIDVQFPIMITNTFKFKS